MAKDDALIGKATLNGKTILTDGGKGAYVVDNHGRKARLGGKDAEMKFRILQQGPLHTVVRTEGWYVVEGGEGGDLPKRPRAHPCW